VSRGELFGPYRLEELIGRGGMGEVYRAHDTVRDRVVALKILPTAMAANPQFEARFRKESQLVARLSAPHIIPIHDFGEIDGRLFLDMRLVRGVDLATVLESGPLSPPRAVEMISQVASALDAAHADGLVHRDVKPSNVLYVGDPRERPPDSDQADFVYLVDFGIARSLDEGTSLTATGHAVGTLGYMAPERFSGNPTDRRIDVYALACTLYEALVGRPAFEGDGLAQMMFAHLHRMPPPVSTVVPGVPSRFDAVLGTGLAKNPAQRCPTAGRLAEAARAALPDTPRRTPTRPLLPEPGPRRPTVQQPAGGPPVARHPVASTPRTGIAMQRATRRRAVQVGGAAAAALALVVGAVVGIRTLSTDPSPPPGCDTAPLTCNGADAGDLLAGGQVTVAVDSNIENWNVADPSGSLGPTVWAMGSVLPYAFSVAPDFTPTLNTDLLADARQTTPTTVTYTLKPAARWDDGTPVGVDDFTLNWRLRNGRDCPDCPGDQAGYDRISAITGSPTPDGGSTVLVTFDQPYPDWATLFSSTDPLYPAHLAARQGDLGTPAGLRAASDWFGATVPTYSAGPLAVQSWQPDQALVLTRNPRWYGRPARLDRVVLQVVADPAAQVQALRENRVQVIAPNARAGLAEQLAGQADVQLVRGASLGWERLDLNLRTPALRQPALRQALFTAVDLARVRAIGAEVFGGTEPMGSHAFVPGQPGYADVLAGTGQGTGDLEAARRMLTAAGYTGVGSALAGPDGVPVPPLRALYATANPARPRTAEYVAEAARGLGLTVTTSPMDPGSYGSTLSGGQFDLVLYGWAIPAAHVADAQQSWSTDGPSNYTGFSDARVDRLLTEAAASPDPAVANELLGQADRLLTEAAVVLPLYRRSTLLAIRQDVANVRDNPAVGPLYNVAEWGLRG
jgi:peptide/nickel transport system substrate-binding protein